MASRATVNWGILGVAKINDRLLPAFARAANVRLLAIASRDAGRAQSAAAAAGIPKAHASYEALLDDPQINVVYIPLPNHLHEEWTRRAADAGKHVLCEKPLTPDAESAQRLVDYCRARNVKLMDGFMWPHHPRTAQLRQLLDDGAIGQVERVDTSFTFQLPLDPTNIRLQPGMGGGGLLDVGCYCVYGIRWAMGAEPLRVFATGRFEFGVDLSLTAILWFADDRTATFDCGFTLPLRQRMEITGSDGVIRVPEMWVPGPEAEYSIQHQEEAPVVHQCAGANQIVRMLEAFSAAVVGGYDPGPGADEAVRSLRVMDGLLRSAREQRAVDL